MLTTGEALKVTVYLDDCATRHGVPTYTSVLDLLFHHDIAGATVLKGVAGYGLRHRMHAEHILEISDHMPILVRFIDTRAKVEAILPELEQHICSGLIEVETTYILVPAPREGQQPLEPLLSSLSGTS